MRALNVEHFILSLGIEETLKALGQGIVIGFLVVEVFVILLIPSGKLEKSLAFTCTLLIACGVYVGGIADKALQAPRVLNFASS